MEQEFKEMISSSQLLQKCFESFHLGTCMGKSEQSARELNYMDANLILVSLFSRNGLVKMAGYLLSKTGV